MTPEMTLVLIILSVALLLFITERLRMDLIALLVLAALAITGLITSNEALSGFSSPAVVTVWAVFILSSGLHRTGVASMIGRQLHRIGSGKEWQIILAIMLVTSLLSAFINNVGAVALLLPVVMDISRRTGEAPSKLLIPLAAASVLGGMTTLIGTPPNILINGFLSGMGDQPFGFFEFAKIGLPVMLLGALYMITIGRRLLPSRHIVDETTAELDAKINHTYHLEERLYVLRVPGASKLAGKSLANSRLGAALGLNVIAVLREGQKILAPPPTLTLAVDDRLIVEGRIDRLLEIQDQQNYTVHEGEYTISQLNSKGYSFVELHVAEASELVGRTIFDIGFRSKYGVSVLAVEHEGASQRTNLQQKVLSTGDHLLLYGQDALLAEMNLSEEWSDFSYLTIEQAEQSYHINEYLRVVSIPSGSVIAGRKISESQLADTLGIAVLGILREDQTYHMPGRDDVILAGEKILVEVWQENLDTLEGLKSLEIIPDGLPDIRELTSDSITLAEVVLSPYTTLSGKNLRELHFREKYGLSALAIFRGGKAYRSRLREIPLRFGDALLLYGSTTRFRVLAAEPDFIVLTEAAQVPTRKEKAPLAVLIMLGVILPVVLGILPIAISAVAGAALMVLTGCLRMEEAYHDIEWKAVFLLAGMLPLGIAMEKTGTAQYIAGNVVAAVGPYGEIAILAGMFGLTALATQLMPSAAVTVLMTPIAANTSLNTGISIYSLAMLVAVASSSSFLSPISHPSYSLVVGPGGYRFTDFFKVGMPLLLLIFALVLILLPILWPI